MWEHFGKDQSHYYFIIIAQEVCKLIIITIEQEDYKFIAIIEQELISTNCKQFIKVIIANISWFPITQQAFIEWQQGLCWEHCSNPNHLLNF